MNATDISAAQHRAHRTSLLVCASLAVTSLIGCKSKPSEGISAICDSNGKNKYYLPIPGKCPLKNQQSDPDCYAAQYGPIFKCYGKDEWLDPDPGDTGDDGEAAETDGIDRYGWPTHEPSLTYIRKYCSDQCKSMGGPAHDNAHLQSVCDGTNWIIYGYDGIHKIFSKMIATRLQDPGALNCDPDLGKWKGRSPAETNVVQDDNVLWPSDGSVVELPCSTIQGCAELFDENVMAHLMHRSPTPQGHDEAEADYLVTAGIHSSLMLRVANPDDTSQASNPVEGRVEYTALDCGQPTCPLYLANLTVTNSTETWDLQSEALGADIEVTNLQVRLRRPTLGVWRPATGEVYFGDQMLDLYVELDLAIAGDDASTVTSTVTNDGGLFGIRHGNHAIELSNLSVHDEDMEAHATLDYDSVDGSPPVASFTLPPTVVLDQSDPGLLVASIPEHSTDPDDDLDWKLWLIDHQQVAPGFVIPAGPHTIRLEVRDSRFAFDAQEQQVTITYEDQE